MGKFKTYIKRGIQYIKSGVPEKITKVNVAQIQYGGILEGKKILITGGSKGLGYAIAKRCLEEKALVTITGRKMEALEEAKHKLGDHPNLFLMEHNIMDVATDDAAIEKASSMMGGLDALINNAGVSLHEKSFREVSEENWDLQLDTNLKGSYFMAQAFMKHYEANNMSYGKIINMVSERGMYGDQIPYGLTKRALISFTEGMAKMLITKGVRVNAIAPGVTATEMTGNDPEGNLYRKYAVGKRVLLAEEIAETAIFLLSDAANCISGQVIACNEANIIKSI